MLEWLRHEATIRLARITACTLATAGPAGVQASWEECLAHGLRLYFLVSAAADHIINLESTNDVALAGEGWRLVGTGKCLTDTATDWLLTRHPWQVVIEIIPTTFYLAGEQEQTQSIDFIPLHPKDGTV